MKVISGERASGKSVELCKESLEKDIPILVFSVREAEYLKEKSYYFFGKPVRVISLQEIEEYQGEILIDDLDEHITEIIQFLAGNNKISVDGFVTHTF